MRHIEYAILKTKNKTKQRPRASNIICIVKDQESDKPCWRKNAEAICVSPFGGRVGGGLAPIRGNFSYPLQFVFNSLLFFLIS